MNNYFLNTSGVYALLALIPFLIFYIVRPKPRKVVIPSLMFFIRDKDKSNLNSFFQKFIRDALFFFQFIVLILLCLAVAQPYSVVPSISYSDTVVFVIDGSASMNAKEDGKTRFDRAIDVAQNHIETKNTIILATDRSELILENAGSTKTKTTLMTLKPKQTQSLNIYDSLVTAENFALTDNSAVFFISDFSSDNIETEFLKAKIYLESKGIDVFFEDVSKNNAENIGIIDLDVKDTEVTVWIKNFKDSPETIEFEYGDKYQQVELNASDVKAFTMTTLPGESKIDLKIKDDFKIDNIAYISTPKESSTNILLITNDDETYIETVFSLMENVKITKQHPPIVDIDNPDIIILGNVNKKVLIPGDINKIKRLVSQGVPLIILSQEDILNLNLGPEIFPLKLRKTNPVNINDFVIPVQENSYITPNEIQFGTATKAYEIEPINPENNKYGVIVYAKTNKNNYPVITLHNYGKGKVLYYGLFDKYSDFKADIYYPIFWKRALDVLLGGKTIGELNKNTGFLQIVPKDTKIKGPTGSIDGPIITMDIAGFYKFPTYTVASNILNEEEQRLNKDKITLESSQLKAEAEKMHASTKKRELTYLLTTIGMIIMLLELLYIKIRGDI